MTPYMFVSAGGEVAQLAHLFVPVVNVPQRQRPIPFLFALCDGIDVLPPAKDVPCHLRLECSLLGLHRVEDAFCAEVALHVHGKAMNEPLSITRVGEQLLQHTDEVRRVTG